MSDKKAIKEPLDTEKAKDLELDEIPKPTRKLSKSSVPAPNNVEQTSDDKIKGRRIVK
jgi:hypothetical protein